MDDNSQSNREKPILAGAVLSSSKLLRASCPDLLNIDYSVSSDSAIVMSAYQRKPSLSSPTHLLKPLSLHDRRKTSLPSVISSSTEYLSPRGGVHCLSKLGAIMKNKLKYSNKQSVGGVFDPTGPSPVCILLTSAGEEKAYQLEESQETGGLTNYHQLLEESEEKVGTLLHVCNELAITGFNAVRELLFLCCTSPGLLAVALI